MFYFVYMFTFPRDSNPPGRAESVAASLREWFESNQVEYGMGAQGGAYRVYGSIHGKSSDETEAVRQLLISWIRAQDACCQVQLGVTRHTTGSVRFLEDEWEQEFDT